MRQVASNQNYQFTLTIKHTDYIVRDHRVHGTRIIPGVTFLDIIYRMALSKDLPIEELECQNILYLEPVATSNTFDREILISFQGSHQGWEIQAKSRKVKDGHVLNENWDKNMQCRLMPKTGGDLISIDIDRIKNTAERVSDMDTCYAYLRKVDIEHFEFMKSLGTVYATEDYVLAELKLSKIAKQYVGYFQMHPTFLDASTIITVLYQACPEYFTKGAAASRFKTYIPIHIESFQMINRLSDTCYVYIEKQDQNHDTGDVIRVSYGLYDVSGNKIAQFTRLSVKHIRSKELIENLKKTSGNLQNNPIFKLKDNQTIKETNKKRINDIESELKELIAGTANISSHDIRADIGFYEQGLDSASLLSIVKELERKTGEQLYPTLLFEYKTIRELAAYIEENKKMNNHFLTPEILTENPNVQENLASPGQALCSPHMTEREIQLLIADVQGINPDNLSIEKGFYEQGLDSVTLLEVVKALEKKSGRELYPTLLFEYTTIRELANYFAANNEKLSAIRNPEKDHHITATTYLTPQWRRKDIPIKGVKTAKKTYLLFQHDRALFNYMQSDFNNDTEQIILVLSGDTFHYHGGGVYEIDHDEEAHFERLASELKQKQQIPDTVIYGWPDGSFAPGAGIINEQLSKGVYPLLFFSKALMRSKASKEIVSLYLYPADNKSAQPLYASVHGAGQSISLENPKMVFKTIGISLSGKPISVQEKAGIIVNESVEVLSEETDIYYEAGERFVRILREAEPIDKSYSAFKENGVYLITGGVGGLGLLFAEHIAAQTTACIILAGRSELSESKKNRIRQIEACGSSVQYIRGDISDSRDAERMIMNIKRQFGKIDGVIHSAGIINDAFLIQKTKSEIQKVLEPKIYGTVLLDSLLQDEPLDFFIMFSSSSSIFGNIGQTDYALANRFVDLFADWREGLRQNKERSGISVAISWPLWEDGGMKVDKQTEDWMKEKIGMIPLRKNSGIKAFYDSIYLRLPQLIVFEGDKEKLKAALHEKLVKGKAGDTQKAEPAVVRDQDIAIIGLSGKYPMADNLNQFWENLKEGKDCITEVPSDRWELNGFFSEERDVIGKSYSKWGGFVNGTDQFDPLFFNISPREAELMDPQERLFLESAKECFEDSGYQKNKLEKMKVGVFVGAMWGQYQLFEGEENGLSFTPASVYSSIANRVSYYFNLKGPSLALDTMCSSSLTSIHYACQSIHCGESDMALAGGVNLSLHPNKYKFLSMGQFLSSDGRCRSFGKDGNGYVPGEGIGAVLLKPLKKAIEDQDQIYGVIKGSSVNHGGKTSGYSIPNPDAQTTVISEALRKADIDPNSISYIEAHGTGTSLGDPIEIQGLRDSYQLDHPCAIGSVKSNIGHLESAAGIAAVTKVLLQMKHKLLVPSLHSDTVNPYIDFDQVPFKVQQKTAEWKNPEINETVYPLRAGVSAFGAGGSNAHLILEAYESLNTNQPQSSRVIFILSAQDKNRLKKYAEVMARFLSENEMQNENDRVKLQDIAYTLQTGREHMEERLAIVADSSLSIAEELLGYTRGETSESSYTGNILKCEVRAEAPRIHKDYEEVARRWVKGEPIDWEAFEENRHSFRVSIPGQPLIKKRYWIKEQTREYVLNSELKPRHPFLGVNTSTFNQYSFTKTIDRDNPFVMSLTEYGKSFFSVVSLIEMAAANASEAFGYTVNKITEISWNQGRCDAADIQELTIELTPREDFAQFEIYAKNSCKNKIRLVHGKAHIVEQKENDLLPSVLDISKVKSDMLEHGFAIPYASETAKNNSEMLSLFFIPDHFYENSGDFTFLPFAFESAIQTSGLFVNGGTPAELIGMNEVTIYQAFTQDFYIYTQIEKQSNNIDLTCHITFADTNGSILAECKGLVFSNSYTEKADQSDDELICLLRKLEANDIDQTAVLKQLMGEES
ncbi:SDR family NAD(P)-dependent oxidoreductase [Bacillus vallismortis]